jgi:hypothetical protein
MVENNTDANKAHKAIEQRQTAQPPPSPQQQQESPQQKESSNPVDRQAAAIQKNLEMNERVMEKRINELAAKFDTKQQAPDRQREPEQDR